MLRKRGAGGRGGVSNKGVVKLSEGREKRERGTLPFLDEYRCIGCCFREAEVVAGARQGRGIHVQSRF